MPLGIEQNNLAPQLVANSGAALVQGIRQIGQQISGHLTEIQTKRDLAALGQEMQGMNVQSDEFPLQLIQLSTRHPLAARDERGQMAMSILGKAHGQWQAGESEARAFKRAMEMQGIRTRDARTLAEEEEARRSKRPVNVAGVGLVNPGEIDPVTGQATVLAPALPRSGSNRPVVAKPGDVVFDPQGKEIARGIDKPLPGTSGVDQRAAITRKMTVVKSRLTETQGHIKALEKRYEDLNTDIAKLDPSKKVNAAKLQQLYDYRGEVGSRLQALGKDREKIREELDRVATGEDEESPDDFVGPPLSSAPSSTLPGAPAVQADAQILPPVPATTELPVLTPAQAAKQPSGTQFRDKNGNVRIVP